MNCPPSACHWPEPPGALSDHAPPPRPPRTTAEGTDKLEGYTPGSAVTRLPPGSAGSVVHVDHVPSRARVADRRVSSGVRTYANHPDPSRVRVTAGEPTSGMPTLVHTGAQPAESRV